jgi:ribosome-binding factor A
MPSPLRLKRIEDRIRQDLSEMLIQQIQDPRLVGISVTDVRVDRELAYCDIFVSAVEGHERSEDVLQGLRSASGFIRHHLAEEVDLRTFPRLRFHWDVTPERADHIEKLLASLKDNENQSLDISNESDDESDDDE